MSYTELAYIRSSQGQYIDTGVASTSDIDYEIQYLVLGGGDYLYQCIIGSDSYHNSFYPYCQEGSKTPSGEYVAYSYNGVMWSHLGVNLQGVKTTLKKTKNVFQLSSDDGFTTTLTHSSTTSFTRSSPILIFAMSKSVPDFCTAILYHCKIWRSGNLVRDFIPVLDERGVACLYDKVSGTYFYNQGEGTFGACEISEDGIEYMPIMTGVNAYFDARKNVTDTSWKNLRGDTNFELFNPSISENGVEVVGSEVSYGKFTKPWTSGSSRTWYFVFKNVSGAFANWKTIIGNEASQYKCSTIAMDGNGYIKFTRPDIVPSTSLGFKCSDWHVVAWVSNGSSQTTKLWIDGTYIASAYNMQGWADDTYLCRGSNWSYADNNTVFRAIAIADSAHADTDVVSNSNWLRQQYANEYIKLPPEEVTRLPYIEATGTQYIDLGFKLTQNHKIDIKFMVSGNSAVFGSRNNANSNNIAIAHSIGGGVVIDFNNGSCETYRVIQVVDGSSAYRVVLDKNGRFIYDEDDNLLSSSTTVCSHTIVTPGNAYLFWMSYNTNGWGKATGRIYYCKIYDGDNLVREFHPAISSGGTVGMWDAITGHLYTNAGTGNFLVYDYVTEGSAVFVFDDLSRITSAKESAIRWMEHVPDRCSLNVFARMDSDDFLECSNGSSIPCISIGDDLSSKSLEVKVVMSTEDVSETPTLTDMTIAIGNSDDDHVLVLEFESGNTSSLQNAVGDIDISYGGGTLHGVGGAVAPFDISFTPDGYIAKNHPHDAEHIEIVNLSANAKLIKVRYVNAKSEEHIVINDISAQGNLISVDDI